MKRGFIAGIAVLSGLLLLIVLQPITSATDRQSSQPLEAGAAVSDEGLCSGLVSKYENARNSEDRRLVCLQMLDAGLVKRDMSLVRLRQLFGKDVRLLPHGESADISYAVVNFERLKEITIPAQSKFIHRSRSYTGWYISFSLDSDKNVLSYCLSNLYKPTVVPEREVY